MTQLHRVFNCNDLFKTKLFNISLPFLFCRLFSFQIGTSCRCVYRLTPWAAVLVLTVDPWRCSPSTMELDKLKDLIVPQLGNLANEELRKVQNTLENLLQYTNTLLDSAPSPVPKIQESSSPSSSSPPSPSPPLLHYNLRHDPLSEPLVEEVLGHVKKINYSRSGTNLSPDTFLYGSQRYAYNRRSAALSPVSIQPNTIMDKLLKTVNLTLGTEYNSMLVNKYSSYVCCLPPHKDDEAGLDPGAPISTLSIGSTRKMNISLDKKKSVKYLTLTPGSIFTMLPGFQQSYYHEILAGDKDVQKERGVRYSVTFRRLLPPKEVPPAIHSPPPSSSPPPPQPSAEPNTSPATSTSKDATYPDTFVFGSSLLKSLKTETLSKRGKIFKVISRSGAHACDIYNEVEKCAKQFNTSNVSTVFLQVGGNDVENLILDSDIKRIFEDIYDLIILTKQVFPVAKINFFSLVPRKASYLTHIRNMHKFNDLLSEMCKKESIRFVDIFSFFLKKTPTMWLLDFNLFNRDGIHLNPVGTSVLAKVLIGVANQPR